MQSYLKPVLHGKGETKSHRIILQKKMRPVFAAYTELRRKKTAITPLSIYLQKSPPNSHCY